MSMVVRSNINSMNANRNLGINNSQVAKAIEKLASGYAINRAADDASGLAISEKMKAQITGLEQASENCQDGLSLVKVAEGACNELHDILNRIVELSVKASNGTISDEVDRESLQLEFQVLCEEIDRISQSTNFNGIYVFEGIYEDISYDILTQKEIEKSDIEVDEDLVFKPDGLDVTIVGGVSGIDFVLNTKTGDIEILTNTPLMITGSEVTSITINTDNAVIALREATITSTNSSGIVTGSNNLTLYLEGDNVITTKCLGAAGIEVNQNGSLTINGPGSLDVSGDTVGIPNSYGSDDNYGGAAIGGRTYQEYVDDVTGTIVIEEVGDITINGGTITATAGQHSAAIGGTWYFQVVNNITLRGGTITATTHEYHSHSSAIGCGCGGSVDGDITIYTNYTNIDYVSSSDSDAIGPGWGTLNGEIIYIDDVFPDDDASGNTGTNGTVIVDIITTITNRIYNLEDLILQVGETNESYQKVSVPIVSMRCSAMGLSGADMSTEENAGASLNMVHDAINYVSQHRCSLGAIQNRLEYTINNLNNIAENITSANSVIRDTDMASEMIQYTKMGVLVQSAQSMLSQSNQSTQQVLSLLE